MIIIYDFDGTLTPYSLPQYQILKQCGYTDKKLRDRLKLEMDNEPTSDLYISYYKCYQDILTENGITMTKDAVCLGAKNVEFNKGVEDYFKRFQYSKTGVKHYIVTSGIQDYVEETSIAQLTNGIYGVTYKQENDKFTEIDFLLSDKEKINIIKSIQNQNKGTKEILYFGDGLTDEFAFEYVHNIGGKTIFIASNKNSEETYKKINQKGIIDNYFEADFEYNSELSKFIQKQIELEMCL